MRFNFGASNVLARQIVSGAPVDVFISADEAQMDVVAAAGLVKDGIARRRSCAISWRSSVPSDRPRTFKSIREIADPAFKRIAIGDPAAVPAGVYAKQYLEKEGLWTARRSRASCPPAACARRWPRSSRARPTRRSSTAPTSRVALKATVAWVVPADRGPRIVYPAAIVKTTAAARRGEAIPRLPARAMPRRASSSASGSRSRVR